jgi:hypothetical protein
LEYINNKKSKEKCRKIVGEKQTWNLLFTVLLRGYSNEKNFNFNKNSSLSLKAMEIKKGPIETAGKIVHTSTAHPLFIF